MIMTETFNLAGNVNAFRSFLISNDFLNTPRMIFTTFQGTREGNIRGIKVRTAENSETVPNP